MRLIISVLFLLPFSLFAQKIEYVFSAPNAAHHEAQITVKVTGLKPGPATFTMSRSSPGRYAKHEFGKNVYNVSATDANGKTLAVQKTDADVYRVNTTNGAVRLSYTLYGNYADGTYVGIDPTGYHLNMPATFMWVKGYDKAPITLKFNDVKNGWTIATQLKPSADQHTFSAPGLQYFMDSPTKVGKLHWRQWTITNPDKKQYTMRLALEADAPDSTIDDFTERLKKIVNEAQAVFGEVPAFDYGTYTFIASLNPYVHGDGMEHRNSTMISSGRQFTGANNFLNTFAHEFFHCWNVERIRPKSLEPFNFEKSNMSEGLWIAEGFTQYYGALLMKRAGLSSDNDFYMQMSGLINVKENTPGGKYYTPIENSQRAVFVDAGVSIDQTNYPNMFASYYPYGGALALALDLRLRKQYGKTMDGFMQQLWKAFGKTEKAYTLPEVQQVLAGYTSAGFAKDFFDNQVYGHKSIDYSTLLQPAGLELKNPAAGKAWIGNVRYAPDTSKVVIASSTVKNSPLYDSGVDVDDVLVQIGGVSISQPSDIQTFLSSHKPGETVKLVFRHRSDTVEKEMKLGENPMELVAPVDAASTAQQGFREQWMQGKAKSL
ncbi:MAG: M61 family metallopeptidase [Flavisolibacter sp.]